MADDYGIDPSEYRVDFDGQTQFFQGNISIDQIEEENVAYPCLILSIDSADNSNNAAYAMFSGEVYADLTVWLSWDSEHPLSDFDTPGDAIEEALVRMFNPVPPDPVWAPLRTDNTQVAWTGKLNIKRGPVTTGGKNWLQPLFVRFTFYADVH